MIDQVDPQDTPLLALLGWREEASQAVGADSLEFECFSTTHTWLTDELIPSYAPLNAAYVAAQGYLDLGTTAVEYFEEDDQLFLQSGTNNSHYQVTSIDSVNGYLYVRILGGDAAHASATNVYNLGKVVLDGAEAEVTGKYTTIEQTSNYTQIFSRTVAVSGTEEAVNKYGVESTLNREVEKKFKEQVIQLEQAAHYGLRNSSIPTSNAQPGRRMGGLYYFIRSQSAANRTDASGASLTETLLQNLLEDIFADTGGTSRPDTILVNSWQKRKLNDIWSPFVRGERDDGVAGVVVNKYESDFGVFDVVLDRHLGKSDLVVVAKDRLGIGPLRGRGVESDRVFRLEALPKSGDSYRRFIIGEYTMEVRQGTACHGWLYNLATS